MTADPADPFGRPVSGPGVAFALHPAALRPGAPLPAPRFAARPRPAATETAAAPPWIAPYRHETWALPRVEQRLRLAPPAMPLPPPRTRDTATATALPAPAEPTLRNKAPAPQWTPPPVRPVIRRHRKRWAAAAGLAPLAAVATAIALLLRPPAPAPAALFTTPRLVLRGAADGVGSPVPVDPAAAVLPQAALPIMLPAPADPPALRRLHAQLDALYARAGLIDAALAQTLPGMAARTQALRRLRQSIAAEIEQFRSLASTAASSPRQETPLQAGLRGTVLSMNTPPGASAR